MDARVAGILAFDGTRYLDRIQCPTMVLVAEDDILTPPYSSQLMAEEIAGATLIKVPYGGHAYSRTQPAQFNEIVLTFLAEHAMSKRIAHEQVDGDVVLRAEGVGMVFNRDTPEAVMAIADIGFDLHRGEVVAIVGPSGCGKTTLFNIIAGLLEPTQGRINVNGEPVHSANGHVGYMLQKDLLLPWRTVMDNVIIGLQVRHTPRKQAEAKAMTLIEAYGLKGF